MPDLLTCIREELAVRLEASRQAVDEYDRLQAALRVLDANAGDGRAPRSPKRLRTRGRQGQTAARARTQSPAQSPTAATPTLDADAARPTKARVQRRRVRRS